MVGRTKLPAASMAWADLWSTRCLNRCEPKSVGKVGCTARSMNAVSQQVGWLKARRPLSTAPLCHSNLIHRYSLTLSMILRL